MGRQETLTQLLLAGLRKGGATEATAAARGLCLLAVTLGAGAEAAQLLRTCLGPLVDTARCGWIARLAVKFSSNCRLTSNEMRRDTK